MRRLTKHNKKKAKQKDEKPRSTQSKQGMKKSQYIKVKSKRTNNRIETRETRKAKGCPRPSFSPLHGASPTESEFPPAPQLSLNSLRLNTFTHYSYPLCGAAHESEFPPASPQNPNFLQL